MAQNIIIDPSFMGLYRGCLCEMMSLMQHIIKSSRVLIVTSDAGQHHAMENTSNEGGNDDDKGDDHDRDDEGGDHDDFGSTTPSNHGH